jgi:ATP-binding cassette subfamily B (MDR/TAP) protein 1
MIFSLLPRRQLFLLLFPAIVASFIAGGIAPFMTRVVGQSFDAFSDFPLSPNPPEAARKALLRGVGQAALQLVALAFGALAMGAIMSSLWICLGENNALALRNHVYETVTNKDLEWFDRNMEVDLEDGDGDKGAIGAGGLMAKFARETDDVRMASSLAAGATLQHLTTTIACLLLAFVRSFSLTLVILATIPLLIILQGISQSLAAPLLASERSQTATVATLIARAISSISTVKAFNAADQEHTSISRILSRIQQVSIRLISVWAVTSSLAQFVTMAMFAQGFWFGSKLVREGKISSGDVMAVFWACLIATSNLQMCIPQLIVLEKGKTAMASLLSIAPVSPTTRLRKIIPPTCVGELAIQDVTFSYPSRSGAPVVQDLNIFLPARETTFIVGGSGSGKSTIANLLQNLYAPQAGSITLDDQDISFLDDAWLRRNVACISQQSILFDMSLHDNVALGREGATRAQVVSACTRALMHDFVRALPDGYDTILGVEGANLSGGQRQRLAIARAMLRDPPVLILDESTSALDATSRLLVFEAIRRWRKNKTTVVITHDLSQIGKEDFVYALKNGQVIEQGYRADLDTVNGGEWRSLIDLQRKSDDPSKRSANSDADQRPDVNKAAGEKVTSERQSLKRPSVRPFSIVEPKISGGRFTFDLERTLVQRTGAEATRKRQLGGDIRDRRRGSLERPAFEMVSNPHQSSEYRQQQPFRRLVRDVYSSIPNVPLVVIGLVACILNGVMTPVFSFLLSRLLFEVSIGASNVSTINKFGAIVLGAAALDGLFFGLKYFIMEAASNAWLSRLRSWSFRRILAQDRKWFDSSANSAVAIVQILIKDGDDAKILVSDILGQCVVVFAMLSVGLVWAMIMGWQLTMAGLAIAPVFAVMMFIQTRLVTKCEVRNKRAREDVVKGYYEVVSNIRGIRAMAFENIFKSKFENFATIALSVGVHGAVVEGCTYGIVSALIYFAEALLFYVGAVLMAKGTYSYLQMIEVLNLIVFSVTIGSQLMAFTERIAKSMQAARTITSLLNLSTRTDESGGRGRQTLDGAIVFEDVSFSYPERQDVPVLKNFFAKIEEGECVAVVGSSGSGKSTLAALLQRLYEPSSGTISVGNCNVALTDVTHLRKNVAVVSQKPYLFHATIADNIAYGNLGLSHTDILRAAKAANLHDFIMSLPRGYDTMIGEDASFISGGEAQRIQIARALARPCKILILDECTSALDPKNEVAILDTVRRAKFGRKTIMVTHKLPVMKMCDRILVMHEGVVAEDGTYRNLMARNSIFARLARAGEWVPE